MERVDEASRGLSVNLAATQKLRAGLRRLAPELHRHGVRLQRCFSDMVLSKDLNEGERAVVEFLVAWREVGEAYEGLSKRAASLAEDIQHRATETKAEEKKHLCETRRLRSSLRRAEMSANGCFGWVPQTKREAKQADLEAQGKAVVTELAQVAERIEAERARSGEALEQDLAEMRRQTKAVGEKLCQLKPSWRSAAGKRGGSGGIVATAGASKAEAGGKDPWRNVLKGLGVLRRPEGSGKEGSQPRAARKVSGLIRTLATSEGRRRFREAESKASQMVMPIEEVLTAPPILQLGETEWRIHGVYDHQALKAGLRSLDAQWPDSDIDKYPQGKDGVTREKLFRDLLSGSIRLQSMPKTDVSSAQRDLQRLSLRQLLRLRVLHLDYVPSGAADSVHTVGATHEAFMGTLDNQLFKQLGQKALGPMASGIEGNSGAAGSPDTHRLGREAVLFAAAAAALEEPKWWCWWLSQDRRVFFDAKKFACAEKFPIGKGGVLEVTDNSRRDPHEPTGRLRWLDWRVIRIDAEASLASAPPRAQKTSDDSSDTGASGAGTAALVSPTVLYDARNALKPKAN